MKYSTIAAAALCMVAGNATGQFDRVILVDEIYRHVIDECDLFSRFEKNRIDFDPIEVTASIIPDIIRDRRQARQDLSEAIYSVVGQVQSFYRRAMIYDVYYGVCLETVALSVAEERILEVASMVIDDADIKSCDDTISANLSSNQMNGRVNRDECRIAILQEISESADEQYIRQKNVSVIQEYMYDIELWTF